MHGQRLDVGRNAATAEHDEQRAELIKILGLEILVGAVRLENVHHADTADPKAVSLGHEDVAVVHGATGEIVGVDGLQSGEQLDGDAPEKVFEERSGARQDVLRGLRRREREKHFEETIVETGRGGVEVVDEENGAIAEVAVAQSDDVGVMNALPRIQNHRLSHNKKRRVRLPPSRCSCELAPHDAKRSSSRPLRPLLCRER